jgi:hydroxymethylbilane synthase
VGARDRIVLGSRGSELALIQARLVEQALRAAWPDLEVATEIIRTSGDENAAAIADRKAGRKGMFTRAIEQQLLVRQIDLAVHSAKDLPSAIDPDLEIRAALPRAKTEDVLITKNGESLTSLPGGATVATGSVRRQHQLRWLRPDLQVAELRGNVPTRLRKLRENENWSGIILARAGLDRLALDLPMEILSPNEFLPAGGQGVIALQIRRDDAGAARFVDAIDHRLTTLALRAEREFLRLLDGDCDSPVGVQASLGEDVLHLRAQIFDGKSSAPKTGLTSGSRDEPEAAARALMQLIYG